MMQTGTGRAASLVGIFKADLLVFLVDLHQFMSAKSNDRGRASTWYGMDAVRSVSSPLTAIDCRAGRWEERRTIVQ
jgi:hypothetical protein